MNTTSSIEGFQEVAHTSDLALEVWAMSQEALFLQAAEGLRSLLGIRIDHKSVANYQNDITGFDQESLLVSFLSDLLFLVDHDNCWIKVDQLTLSNLNLDYSGKQFSIHSLKKQLKAVTFHKLRIINKDNHWKTRIVFDV